MGDCLDWGIDDIFGDKGKGAERGRECRKNEGQYVNESAYRKRPGGSELVATNTPDMPTKKYKKCLFYALFGRFSLVLMFLGML